MRAADHVLSEAVRGSFAMILSRSFADGDGGDGARQLIPLLDALQHGSVPNIEHTDEWRQGEALCVVRASTPLDAGAELLNSYGAHAGFVFASHYGFVPREEFSTPLYLDEDRHDSGLMQKGGAPARHYGATRLELAAAELAVLAEGGSLGFGLQLALGAHEEAESGGFEHVVEGDPYYGGGGSYAYDEHGGGSLPSLEEGASQRALANLIVAAGAYASYPLSFIVSSAQLDHASTWGARGAGLDALTACARACAVDAAELEAFDGNGPNERLEAAIGRLASAEDGLVSARNYRRAAAIIRGAARDQLEELEASAKIQ